MKPKKKTKAEPTREEIIKKSIKLIGWLSTSRRIKTEEDKIIFDRLKNEYINQSTSEETAILEEHGISFEENTKIPKLEIKDIDLR